MLPILVYYVVLGVTGLLAWPHTYGTRSPGRFLWLALGGASVALPVILPVRLGVYYGLALNTTVFLWASDSHMDPHWGTRKRRWRALAGVFVICLLPLFWSFPLGSWLSAILVPTLGHLMISGVATPLIRRVAAHHDGGIRRSQ